MAKRRGDLGRKVRCIFSGPRWRGAPPHPPPGVSEREGFEPPSRLRRIRFSRPARSATPPSLHSLRAQSSASAANSQETFNAKDASAAKGTLEQPGEHSPQRAQRTQRGCFGGLRPESKTIGCSRLRDFCARCAFCVERLFRVFRRRRRACRAASVRRTTTAGRAARGGGRCRGRSARGTAR